MIYLAYVLHIVSLFLLFILVRLPSLCRCLRLHRWGTTEKSATTLIFKILVHVLYATRGSKSYRKSVRLFPSTKLFGIGFVDTFGADNRHRIHFHEYECPNEITLRLNQPRLVQFPRTTGIKPNVAENSATVWTAASSLPARKFRYTMCFQVGRIKIEDRLCHGVECFNYSTFGVCGLDGLCQGKIGEIFPRIRSRKVMVVDIN